MSGPVSSAPLRAGPPSPSSPPAGLLKANHPSPSSNDHTPQTPTSPPLMSVSAQNYASSFTSTQASPSQATSQGASLSSPPSSAPMSTQVSQQPAVTTTSSFPTPASSVSGHLMGASSTDDLENAEKSFGQAHEQNPEASSDVKGAAALSGGIDQTGHRRTDHDRQWRGDDAGGVSEDVANMGGQDAAKDPNAMEVDEKGPASSSEEGEPSLASLQEDIGSAFHLCKTSYTMTGPDPRLDLISLYGLGPIAKSVARTDPVTGEKINRLRKSYEGKLKGLGLAGRNKPVKHEPGTPGGLREMTMWPEEEWRNQKVFGKEIKVAEIDSALHKLQTRAMKMEPGPVPNNEYWEDVLGHEKPSKHVSAGKEKAAVSASTPRPPSQPNGAPAVAEPERTRPSRGRKRRYDDNSYVGYGEGYADDDPDDAAFYSNGEDGGKVGKKRQKKDHISKVSPTIPDRGGSYGVGMFGIGAR